ncbi:MAG TPA: hypothetical protein VNR87_17035 [Flavisolibacter sp.]|nr:hypothetical protein [Flavisolibacter sp.]
MDIKIALFEKGLLATYAIDRMDGTTFNARLKAFTGESKPPSYIKFQRTPSGWRSAFEDRELIRELGAAVDRCV